jgi:hypothetical protein
MNWLLKTGEKVVDRHNSHLHKSVSDLLPEVFSHIQGGEAFVVKEVDLGRVVGVTHCVEVGPNDEIYFEMRPGRKGPSKFVLNREPEPSSWVTVILKGTDTGYVLISAWIGRKSEPEVWDQFATPQSRKFWTEHALIPEK